MVSAVSWLAFEKPGIGTSPTLFSSARLAWRLSFDQAFKHSITALRQPLQLSATAFKLAPGLCGIRREALKHPDAGVELLLLLQEGQVGLLLCAHLLHRQTRHAGGQGGGAVAELRNLCLETPDAPLRVEVQLGQVGGRPVCGALDLGRQRLGLGDLCVDVSPERGHAACVGLDIGRLRGHGDKRRRDGCRRRRCETKFCRGGGHGVEGSVAVAGEGGFEGGEEGVADVVDVGAVGAVGGGGSTVSVL
ncbi:uncharacterized protein PpBr36_06703 [Pyricularia pennisetigena]|uniref:uncharacterized protein n=1 Tax=Pyricularia pennisetigena TaxID=1578925 RepID=UPI001153BDCE|nr:uncharacterized protein PpBr36_06703 [Pyricularia pennisetigena]TLS22728.1 hypothetical protein PpBr36_06703 [Pyricularia pennisetigena]